MYTTEYYSGMEKNKILLFAIAWMHLDGIKLSKTSLREKDQYYLYYQYYQYNPLNVEKFFLSPTHRNEIGKQLPRTKGWEKWRKAVKIVWTFSYEMNKVWAFNVQRGDYSW